jgi:Phage integrase family
MWHKLAESAGVRPIRLHGARHSCGTALHLRGVPMAVIAKWLGNADAATTARIYAHSQDDALRAAGQSLGAVDAPRDTEAMWGVGHTEAIRGSAGQAAFAGAPDRIRTCGLLLRRQL